MRKYEKTHPWLKFSVELDRAPAKFWLLLGEAVSKCEHLAGVPLRPDVAEKLHRVYLAKGALATTAIEGNTLSEEDALAQVEGKLKLPPSKEYLSRELENVIFATNVIGQDVLDGDEGRRITTDQIRSMNRMILDGLTVGEDVQPGEIREHSVGVALYRGAPPEDCEYLLDQLCEWLNGPGFEPNEAFGISPALIRAMLAHLYIAWIHPFGDGNGQTARLLEFKILVAAGVPTPAAHLFSNHYNETRSEYYRQLDRASRSGGDTLPFMLYAIQGFVDQLRMQIHHIRQQQLEVSWTNFVYGLFPTPSESEARRRDLVLSLSSQPSPVQRSNLTSLSPAVARSYAVKTDKTLTRDLNTLEKQGLIERTPEGYRARVEIVLAFLPRRVKEAAQPASRRERRRSRGEEV